ncbi:hypothetical protein ACJ73_07201 [Blastomyces percursus]|uniref:Uncharacterized protein n=1 Tax=Blastomyces percursus TaxID=1658174 RepID=A0A1J9QMN6_9EURO|nr:hypothetical protein ACJ73_07201 [Blastomyces percursus]
MNVTRTITQPSLMQLKHCSNKCGSMHSIHSRRHMWSCAPFDEASFQNYIISPSQRGAGAGTVQEAKREEGVEKNMMLLPVSWLIDISAQIPAVLHEHAVLPLEVITGIGAEYGVFKLVLGGQVREELIARAEEMR